MVERGEAFRDALHLPQDAASRPGHYVVRVSICALSDYDATAEFEVQ
jgi:hypothetical protein